MSSTEPAGLDLIWDQTVMCSVLQTEITADELMETSVVSLVVSLFDCEAPELFCGEDDRTFLFGWTVPLNHSVSMLQIDNNWLQINVWVKKSEHSKVSSSVAHWRQRRSPPCLLDLSDLWHPATVHTDLIGLLVWLYQCADWLSDPQLASIPSGRPPPISRQEVEPPDYYALRASFHLHVVLIWTWGKVFSLAGGGAQLLVTDALLCLVLSTFISFNMAVRGRSAFLHAANWEPLHLLPPPRSLWQG